jgi:hypothetical protein
MASATVAAPLSNNAATATPTGDSKEVLPRCRQQRLVSRAVIVHGLPSLREAQAAQRDELLIKKLRLCSYVFNFGDNGPTTEAESLQDTKGRSSPQTEGLAGRIVSKSDACLTRSTL